MQRQTGFQRSRIATIAVSMVSLLLSVKSKEDHQKHKFFLSSGPLEFRKKKGNAQKSKEFLA